ncbi:unnamed protein product, partial [Prorocentrum cordatum]
GALTQLDAAASCTRPGLVLVAIDATAVSDIDDEWADEGTRRVGVLAERFGLVRSLVDALLHDDELRRMEAVALGAPLHCGPSLHMALLVGVFKSDSTAGDLAPQ